jgi:hypothetical protein
MTIRPSAFTLLVFLAACGGDGKANGDDDGDDDDTADAAAGDPDAARERAHLLFTSDFEGAEPLDGWYNKQHCCDYSVSVTDTHGSNAVRFELHDDDPLVSSGVRSEISRDSDPVDGERWLGVRFFLEDYAVDDADESIIQWHHPAGGGSPPLGLWVSNGRFLVTHTTDGIQNESYEYGEAGDAPSDAWVSVVFHIKWSNDDDGILEVWIDGEQVMDYVGPTSYDLDEGNYLKLGVYKWPWIEGPTDVPQRVLYADDLRIGDEQATYADVAP